MKKQVAPALAGSHVPALKKAAGEKPVLKMPELKQPVFKRPVLKKPAALALVGSTKEHAVSTQECPRCPQQYSGSTLKNVSYSLRRHMREAHGVGKGCMQSRANRLVVQRKD